MSAPLWSLGLVEAEIAYRRKHTTPSEALEATLAHIEVLEPTLNAFACVDIAGGRAMAHASDVRWSRNSPLGPLDGAILSIKDNIAVAGLPCAWGSALFADFVPSIDELPVARLRAQGAVLLGKTNVSEFTLGKSTVSTTLFGTTRNPWNPVLTTGASSGGAAAAVASGMGSAALATDGGGSIRRPASHCGLVGLKPGSGRVARRDGLPMILGDWEAIGPLGRSVGDVAALFRAIAKPDSQDRSSWAYGAATTELSSSTKQLRIRYVTRFGDHPVDPAIASRCSDAANRLAALGHIVQSGLLPFDLDLLDRFWPIFSAAGLAWMLRGRDWRGRISNFHADHAERGEKISAADYIDATMAFRTVSGQVGQFFETHDILMTPAVGALPWKAEDDGPPHERAFTRFANVVGIPAIALPAEPADGMPVGFQLVAPWGCEETLLALGQAYESAYPWKDRWPALVRKQ